MKSLESLVEAQTSLLEARELARSPLSSVKSVICLPGVLKPSISADGEHRRSSAFD
ncbi:hypothetical protein H6F77_17525 [Microcoleus sp. FACHB-831]|uniref:hypothetical protein n=1 Tax=Microcoleus sp. FACHB-831 TaxID=2692827 RepID=UPI001686A430|nr:hypothetical protein [Microcoleus sp. FACHB-831]MBD1922855.1 hypothetical protein [Microcoleus sp. FACHB-831]